MERLYIYKQIFKQLDDRLETSSELFVSARHHHIIITAANEWIRRTANWMSCANLKTQPVLGIGPTLRIVEFIYFFGSSLPLLCLLWCCVIFIHDNDSPGAHTIPLIVRTMCRIIFALTLCLLRSTHKKGMTQYLNVIINNEMGMYLRILNVFI